MLKNKVLALLENSKGIPLSGSELAQKLEVTRTAIWKATKALKEEGYSIEAIKRSGYKFVSSNDVLSPSSIRSRIRTKVLGNQIEILKSIGSTNTYIKDLKPATMQEGFVLIANEQTQGRGRKNRDFHSPAGEGIYMSILLKPDLNPSESRFLTICASLAVCTALEATCGFSPQIKWVNDIYASGRKLCGILTEGAVSLEMQNMSHVIIGIGLNTGKINKEVEEIATSVYNLTGEKPERNLIIAEILNHMEKFYYQLVLHKQKHELLEEYRKRLFIIDRTVRVIGFEKDFSALVLGIDDEGNLLVQDDAGQKHQLCSEEVSLIL